MKGQPSSAAHNVCHLICMLFHHSFCTVWFLLEVYVYSKLVRFEVQAMSNIYFYLILLGGFVRQYSAPCLWQEVL